MKRIRILLSAVLVLAALFSLPITGFADGDGGTDCRQMLLNAGGQYFIILPASGSYYDSPKTMYIDVGGKHSSYVYRQPEIDRKRLMNYAYEGSKVLAVAEQKGFVCIIYHDSDNTLRTGWVHASSLSDSYPGLEKTVGSPGFANAVNIGDCYPKWSKVKFTGSEQKYSILDEPIENCVQFVLDYQVIMCGEGTRKDRFLGSREVYVHDGSGWTKVGEFDYNEFGAMRVTVNLKEPMTVEEVAVIAPEAYPYWFASRQNLLDVMTTTK